MTDQMKINMTNSLLSFNQGACVALPVFSALKQTI